MSGGGLPAIPPNEIMRHWLEHELLRYRTMERVHGKSFKREIDRIEELLRVQKTT